MTSSSNQIQNQNKSDNWNLYIGKNLPFLSQASSAVGELHGSTEACSLQQLIVGNLFLF